MPLKRACESSQVLNCIYYLEKFGYTPEQVYLLLSCCPCEGEGHQG